ncbi:MAG: carbon-nitrogen hydrolase family protein [Thalassobaculum sp.]|uniref:carbon-nitrogen hydrolase family protein n=1 Tax=Thalassobaculum sp. TaxID=2022740 RepID=UPI0032F0689C
MVNIAPSRYDGDMRIALLQCAPGAPDTAAGLARLDAAASRAAAAGAALLVTPEMFLTGYAIGPEAVATLAEPADGPAAREAAAIARRHGVALLYGWPERDGDAVYNAVQLIDADGRRLAGYRKTHLFGAVDRGQFSAGRTLSPVVEVGGPQGAFRVALAVCYDIEFPEVARALALAGAEAILVPTANMAPFHSVATRLVPARAEENTVFVAYANYVGHEGGFDYCGLSCVCSPDGRDLARAGTGEELLVADLDRARIDAARTSLTYLRDRRPGLY